MLRYSKPRNHCHRFEELRQKQLLFEKRIAYDPQPHETVIVETKAASTTQITHVRSAQVQQLSPIAPKPTIRQISIASTPSHLNRRAMSPTVCTQISPIVMPWDAYMGINPATGLTRERDLEKKKKYTHVHW